MLNTIGCYRLMSQGLAGWLAVLILPLSGVASVRGEDFKPFAGFWKGRGALVLESGKRETILCRMSVELRDGGREAVQGIQCASTGRDVILRSMLVADGFHVQGTWQDTVLGAQGELKGRLRGGNLRLELVGPKVDARLASVRETEKQSVTVTGKLGPIRELRITMRQTK